MKKLSFLTLVAAGMLLGACSDKDMEQIAQVPAENFEDGAFIGLSLSLPSADNTTRANDDLSNGTEDEFEVKNATLYIFKLGKNSTANPDVAATYVDKVSLGNSYDPDTEGGIDPDKWGNQSGVSGTDDPNTTDVDERTTTGTKITSTYNKATLIPNALASQMKSDTQNNYYAYVIINHNGQIEVSDGDTFATFCGQKFEQIGADIAAQKNVWETGLVMTNAPICNYGGGEAAPTKGTGANAPEVAYTTLVPLDNTKIFGSRTEAESAPAACVYVERAAVKITVEDHRTETTLQSLTVTINGWQVINNEPSYYNTRHINYDGTAAEDWGSYFSEFFTGKNNTYRFVSKYDFAPTLPGTTGHTKGYRTYFAADPHYNVNAVSSGRSALANTVASDARPWIPLKDANNNWNHAYTTENTFDVAHQTWQNTTMVTLKATIGNKGFFTVGKGSQIMYVDDADMTAAGAKSAEVKAAAAIENILKGDNDVASALNALRAKISANNENVTVVSGLTISFTKPTVVVDDTTNPVTTKTVGKTGVPFTVALDYTKGGSAYTAFSGTGEADLKAALEEAIYGVMYSNFNKTAFEALTDESEINEYLAGRTYADEVLLSFYNNGVSYYNVRVKHFGDVETPWSSSGSYIANGGDGVNEIYFGIPKYVSGSTTTLNTPTSGQVTTAHNRFLGRYGVVRDNWYLLSIDKIGKIGDAEPVDPSTITPDTPDDEIENFISVHVHIVPWVLRTQSVEF